MWGCTLGGGSTTAAENIIFEGCSSPPSTSPPPHMYSYKDTGTSTLMAWATATVWMLWEENWYCYYEYITVLSLVNFGCIHLSSVVDPYSEYGSRKVKQEKKSEANQIQDKHFTFRDPAESKFLQVPLFFYSLLKEDFCIGQFFSCLTIYNFFQNWFKTLDPDPNLIYLKLQHWFIM